MAMIPFPSVPMALCALLAGLVVTIVIDRWGRGGSRGVAVASIIVAAGLLLSGTAADTGPIASDAFSVVVGAMVLVVTVLSLLSVKERGLVVDAGAVLCAIGMLVSVSSTDLLLIVLGIELSTVPTYALVALGKTPRRLEAATKYFIVGLAATTLLILGTVLLSAAAGTAALSGILMARGPLAMLGAGALLAGLAFKLGVTPFNLWVPDAYQASAPGVAALLAGGTKKAAFGAIIRLSAALVAIVPSWGVTLAVLAAITMTVPNLIALWQQDARRMVAYSIMTHAGFLLIGLALGTSIGASATVFHMITHTFMAVGALLVLGVFAEHGLDRVEQLRGLGYRNPLLGLSLTLFLLSLAGIPLLSGFASKLVLLLSATRSGMVWLVVLAVLNSVIALYYYFRIIRALYDGSSAGKRLPTRHGVVIAILVCLIVTVALGLYPWPGIDLASSAVSAVGLP